MVIDLKAVHFIESRIREVATVNPHTAPELLMIFNQGYLELHRMVTMLSYEHLKAMDAANRVRSVLLLDTVPDLLKKKGLSSSKDLRDAIIDGDMGYQVAKDRVDQLEAVIELLKGKLKAIEWAYTSVKKILSEPASHALTSNQHRLSGDSGTAPIGTGEVQGFGIPKY